MKLISRDEVLKCLKAYNQHNIAIDELPIIESRPKGKWEDFSCSLCGFTPLIKPMAIDTTKGLIMCTYKYCPSCGAEMECEE